MAKKTKGQELQEQLSWAFPHIGKDKPEQTEKAFKYCEGYKAFLDAGKTERECVKEAVKMLKKAGYKPFDSGESYEPGDKVYYVNRGKSLIATTFGKKPLDQGLRINGAHIDSPRLDLKPNPLYEKEDIAFFKTHYYGGIRKYQWGTIPLAMHGVVVKKNGEIQEVSIGEDEKEPVFCVTDLLPHLAAKQNERPLKDGLKGEELNIVVGSLPFQDEEVKEPVKLMALSLLNEKYGITEKDFFRAEIEMVPAVKARDVGFDTSMIGAYGQDDRVCAYTALTAEIDAKKPAHTTVTILADKWRRRACTGRPVSWEPWMWAAAEPLPSSWPIWMWIPWIWECPSCPCILRLSWLPNWMSIIRIRPLGRSINSLHKAVLKFS